ncbi:hypothetical protein CXG81DRAFT_18487 [Caulochytrium protostelioides]|uniref:Uncharacterized protein n=1 Tax=Caulochytrium protostelioides TaxID=1555241 RepID=A0A4P9X8X6_9FUNG|nr:hypothetical protein CXG81DRAFT_18487 [Caulochytrium protostelioides]|eukprot:RKP01728.1 hypothetical protein CXG81DRAFT_18487 [Caulochytrium protostelioides]
MIPDALCDASWTTTAPLTLNDETELAICESRLVSAFLTLATESDSPRSTQPVAAPAASGGASIGGAGMGGASTPPPSDAASVRSVGTPVSLSEGPNADGTPRGGPGMTNGDGDGDGDGDEAAATANAVIPAGSTFASNLAQWKTIKDRAGIRLQKKRMAMGGSSADVSRATVRINCDAERVFAVLSNPEYHRHVDEQFVEHTTLEQLGETRAVRRLTYRSGGLRGSKDRHMTVLEVHKRLTETDMDPDGSLETSAPGGGSSRDKFVVVMRSFKPASKAAEKPTPVPPAKHGVEKHLTAIGSGGKLAAAATAAALPVLSHELKPSLDASARSATPPPASRTAAAPAATGGSGHGSSGGASGTPPAASTSTPTPFVASSKEPNAQRLLTPSVAAAETGTERPTVPMGVPLPPGAVPRPPDGAAAEPATAAGRADKNGAVDSTSAADTMPADAVRSSTASAQSAFAAAAATAAAAIAPVAEETPICYVFGFLIEPPPGGDGTACHVTMVSQYSPDMSRLELSYASCRKVKSFIEELVSLDSMLSGAVSAHASAHGDAPAAGASQTSSFRELIANSSFSSTFSKGGGGGGAGSDASSARSVNGEASGKRIEKLKHIVSTGVGSLMRGRRLNQWMTQAPKAGASGNGGPTTVETAAVASPTASPTPAGSETALATAFAAPFHGETPRFLARVPIMPIQVHRQERLALQFPVEAVGELLVLELAFLGEMATHAQGPHTFFGLEFHPHGAPRRATALLPFSSGLDGADGTDLADPSAAATASGGSGGLHTESPATNSTASGTGTGRVPDAASSSGTPGAATATAAFSSTSMASSTPSLSSPVAAASGAEGGAKVGPADDAGSGRTPVTPAADVIIMPAVGCTPQRSVSMMLPIVQPGAFVLTCHNAGSRNPTRHLGYRVGIAARAHMIQSGGGGSLARSAAAATETRPQGRLVVTSEMAAEIVIPRKATYALYLIVERSEHASHLVWDFATGGYDVSFAIEHRPLRDADGQWDHEAVCEADRDAERNADLGALPNAAAGTGTADHASADGPAPNAASTEAPGPADDDNDDDNGPARDGEAADDRPAARGRTHSQEAILAMDPERLADVLDAVDQAADAMPMTVGDVADDPASEAALAAAAAVAVNADREGDRVAGTADHMDAPDDGGRAAPPPLPARRPSPDTDASLSVVTSSASSLPSTSTPSPPRPPLPPALPATGEARPAAGAAEPPAFEPFLPARRCNSQRNGAVTGAVPLDGRTGVFRFVWDNRHSMMLSKTVGFQVGTALRVGAPDETAAAGSSTASLAPEAPRDDAKDDDR